METIARSTGDSGAASRREFLRAGAAACLVLPFRLPRAVERRVSRVRFGLCADVHKDIMHDTDERLAAFVRDMVDRDVDFIAQLGDFCTPIEANDSFMDVWRSYPGTAYHVIGNHDTDGGFDRSDTMAYWGMEKGYYSVEHGGVEFIVLDGNDVHDEKPPGYARHVGPEQLAWLESRLAEDDGPVVILSHQSLENDHGLDNGAEVRALLEEANRRAGWNRVLACFSGHHHLDDLVRVNEIPYVQVNSMSYYWVGGKFAREDRYAPEIHSSHPVIKYTAPYRAPLWAAVTIEPGDDDGQGGAIVIEGVESEFVGPSPEEMGFEAHAPLRGIAARVTDRRIPLAGLFVKTG